MSRMLRCTLALLLCSLGLSTATYPASASEMPKDFAYLRDIDPTIQQDMRYAGADNFTGAPVPGYDARECVLLRQVAEALKAVQADLKAKGFGLLVYDCYRPTTAVAAFVAWAKLPFVASLLKSRSIRLPSRNVTRKSPRNPSNRTPLPSLR